MHPRALLLCLALLSAAVPVAGQGNEEAINLRAEVQQVEGDVWRGTGGVRILYQDITIQCDEMQYNRVTERLVARGNVILDQGPKRFTADELHFDLGDKTGTMINATGFMPPMYTFSGSVIEKIDDTHYRIENASFTTCESPDGSPPWSFKVREVLLEEEGYGYFHGAAIKVQGAPVFYLPYFIWPVKRDRSPGLLMPGFGYSQLRGTYVGVPIYLPLGRSYDTTLLLDYFSNGYYGLGTEWRWAPVADARGIANLYAIWDDTTREWQWKLNGSHRQDDFYGFRLQAEVEDLSDVDFFQEFERDFDRSTRRDVYSYVYLTRSWCPGSLNLRADRRVTFDLVSAPATSSDVELRQLPEVELRVRPTRIGRSSLYWDMISSFNYFDVDRGGDLVTSYARADLFPSLSYTLPSPLWLTVTPRVGGRATYYTTRYSEDRRSFLDDPIERLYMTGGVDVVGPSLSRVFDTSVGSYSRFKHVIEPRIEYVYLDGTEDTSTIPVFDEVDSTRFTNRARLVLANRLLGRSREGVSARELGSLELWQEYSFSDPLTRGAERDSQWGSLNGLLRIFPTPATGFDARASFDPLHHNLISTSLAASLRRPIGWLNLTWYQNYNPRTGDRVSSQVRTMVAYRQQGFPLRATVHLAYDIERAEFQQQQFQVNWQGSCWSIAVEYRDLRLGAFPTRDWRVVVSLKGVGALPEIRGSLNPMGN